MVQSTVYVETNKGAGSGVVLGAGGVVTNYHVVDGASSVTVQFADQRTAPAQVVRVDRRRDLALLAVPTTEAPVPLGETEGLQPGAPLLAVGYPRPDPSAPAAPPSPGGSSRASGGRRRTSGSSRPTRRSTPATPAARWWTRRGGSWASSPPASRAPRASTAPWRRTRCGSSWPPPTTRPRRPRRRPRRPPRGRGPGRSSSRPSTPSWPSTRPTATGWGRPTATSGPGR